MRIAAKVWRWMTAPAKTYPQPPWPDNRNCRGIGWSGQERTRPFSPPAQPPFAQPTVHENIQAGIKCGHLTWKPSDGRHCLACGALMYDPGD